MATRYESIWNAQVSRNETQAISERTGFSNQEIIQAHLEIFLSLPGIELESRPVRYELWSDYTAAMVAGTLPREEFFYNAGYNPADLSSQTRFWEEWREAMGYPRR